MRPSVGRSKKRVEAVAGQDVVHPAQSQRRVRLENGRRPRGLQASVRSDATRRLHGRDQPATHRGNATPGGCGTGPAATRGLRVRAQRSGGPLHVLRATARLAAGVDRPLSAIVNPLATSWSASRNERTTSSAILRLFMSPSVAHATGTLSFRLDQLPGSSPPCCRPGEGLGAGMPRPKLFFAAGVSAVGASQWHGGRLAGSRVCRALDPASDGLRRRARREAVGYGRGTSATVPLNWCRLVASPGRRSP